MEDRKNGAIATFLSCSAHKNSDIDDAERKRVIELLLSMGANIDMPTKANSLRFTNAIVQVLSEENIEMLLFLLEHNAMAVAGPNGEHPFQYLKSEEVGVPIARYLLDQNLAQISTQHVYELIQSKTVHPSVVKIALENHPGSIHTIFYGLFV